jgi:TPR repeat protein
MKWLGSNWLAKTKKLPLALDYEVTWWSRASGIEVAKSEVSAKLGCSIAENNLGRCYQYRQGVAQDYNKAFEWYLKSAINDGSPDGQCNLGYCYQYGKGVAQNYELAFSI